MRIVRPSRSSIRSPRARSNVGSRCEQSRFPDRDERLLAVENQDITARKRLEDQLRHSQKLEAVGQLAGGVAHDFNNLLAVIQGYGQFLARRSAPEDTKRQDVDQILFAADAASALTRQLLAFSRQQVMKLEVLDPNAVIRELEKMLRRLIGEDIEYIAVLDASVGRVKADVGQVQQILMNLVVNARDAMPNGGKLTLETTDCVLGEDYERTHAGVTPGEYVAISVTDTGTGMDAETQARIFEPFFTTKGLGKGTGLGLSTVYGIVQQSGGHVWVYSEVGRGTTFRIYLPLVEEPTESKRPVLRSDPVRASESVLVVEDNDAVRIAICRILRRAGYHVLGSRRSEQRHTEMRGPRGLDRSADHGRGDAADERPRARAGALRIASRDENLGSCPATRATPSRATACSVKA